MDRCAQGTEGTDGCQGAENDGARRRGFEHAVQGAIAAVAHQHVDAVVDPQPHDQRQHDDVGLVERHADGNTRRGGGHGGEQQRRQHQCRIHDAAGGDQDNHRNSRQCQQQGRDEGFHHHIADSGFHHGAASAVRKGLLHLRYEPAQIRRAGHIAFRQADGQGLPVFSDEAITHALRHLVKVGHGFRVKHRHEEADVACELVCQCTVKCCPLWL